MAICRHAPPRSSVSPLGLAVWSLHGHYRTMTRTRVREPAVPVGRVFRQQCDCGAHGPEWNP